MSECLNSKRTFWLCANIYFYLRITIKTKCKKLSERGNGHPYRDEANCQVVHYDNSSDVATCFIVFEQMCSRFKSFHIFAINESNVVETICINWKSFLNNFPPSFHFLDHFHYVLIERWFQWWIRSNLVSNIRIILIQFEELDFSIKYLLISYSEWISSWYYQLFDFCSPGDVFVFFKF